MPPAASPAPIYEVCLADVEDALAGVTVANGCSQTLVVARKGRPIEVNVDWLTILQQGSPSPANESPVGFQDSDLSFTVATQRLVDESDTEYWETSLNRAGADIVRALLADPTRGGHALDTAAGAPTVTGNILEVPFTISYRTIFNDPYRET